MPWGFRILGSGMRKVAITGGIAEGKSTVVGYLQSLGYRTASADALAREVFLDEEVQAKLATLIGVELPVTPEALRAAIGANVKLRRETNRIMHPQVREKLRRVEADFVEVPLLIEACIQSDFDEVWVVTCGREEQFRRLEARVGRGEAVKLIGTQLPSEVKESFADHVIRTNRPEEAVFQDVRAFARAAAVR